MDECRHDSNLGNAVLVLSGFGVLASCRKKVVDHSGQIPLYRKLKLAICARPGLSAGRFVWCLPWTLRGVVIPLVPTCCLRLFVLVARLVPFKHPLRRRIETKRKFGAAEVGLVVLLYFASGPTPPRRMWLSSCETHRLTLPRRMSADGFRFALPILRRCVWCMARTDHNRGCFATELYFNASGVYGIAREDGRKRPDVLRGYA